MYLEVKMKRLMIIGMAVLMLLPMPSNKMQAAAPLSVVNVNVSTTSLTVGEAVTLTWEVTGGRPPYNSIAHFNAQMYIDLEESAFDGSRGRATLRIQPGMKRDITFCINVSDRQPDNHLSLESDQLGISITNHDGWTASGETLVTLNAASVNAGQPITATIYKEYDTGAGDYMPYTYQWYIDYGDGYGFVPVGRPVRVSGSRYATTTSYTPPAYGKQGYLRVVAEEYWGSGENPPTHTVYSDTFGISRDGTKALAVSLTRRYKYVTSGLPQLLDWKITGGTAPYKLQYQLFGRLTGEEFHPISERVTGYQEKEGTDSASLIVSKYWGPHCEGVLTVTDAKGVSRSMTTDYFGVIESVIPDVTQGDGQVTLSWWSPPLSSDTAVYSYEDGKYVRLANDFGQEASYTVKGLTNGKTYHFMIRVFDIELQTWSALDSSFLVSATPRKPGAPLHGDANGDDVIDIRDLVSVIEFIVNGTKAKSMVNADANQDKVVDIRDLVWIIERIVGA
jgi:hypothetical protein